MKDAAVSALIDPHGRQLEMSEAPLRRITGFYQDEEGHWAARLSCGHGRHMRHRPPMEDRPWVLNEETRRPHLGKELPCLRCANGEPVGD